jgi:tripartite-type tricarboxylate transporter receptor subunit TctC
MTQPRRSVLIAFAAIAVAAVTFDADAQSYPTKPVRIIVPFSPGGASDALPRLLGAKLAELWGQQVIIDNRPGAAGNIGMELGAKAPPDGYTLTSGPIGNLAVNPHMYKLSYDVFKDFTPITMMGTVENGLVVHPSIPARSVKELIALLKARPGELNFGSGGVGTQAHMAGELFKAMTGTDMVHVPYKGVGASVSDLLGGHLAMIFAQMHAVLPYVKAGKLRALGIATAKRSPAFPDLPTIAEAGNLPGFESISWYALIGPAGMPQPLIAKIQGDSAKVLHSGDIREKLAAQGVEPGGDTPDQLRKVMRADYDRYGTIIKKLNIKAE